ncbi:MAG: site-specific integrase [Lachnospiraceae bacterium]|nr:site-specific integrase [Lachnospiraceae bacterium]
MKAEKLPSGNYRVRVYMGRDGNGKAIRKSVTAKTKQEALRKAALLQPVPDGEKTLSEAALEYIEIKEPVISPSTHRGYMKIHRTTIANNIIGSIQLERLTTPQIQRWVSDLARDHSPKTVRNCYGFLTAVLGMYVPDMRFRIRLPQRQPVQLHTPTTEEINAVLAVADDQLRIAILLGATAMMRRGEIAALTAEDVDFMRCRIRINKSLAKTDFGNWVEKPPKTVAGNRTVEINKELLALFPREGSIVGLLPDSISMRFTRALKKAGLPRFRFHDLRHYAASIAASSAIGAGTLTIQARGGWETDHVLKRTYEHSLADQEKKDTAAILTFFSKNIRMGG